MASLDYIFQGAPVTSGAGAIPTPGTKLAPSVGLDVTNNVGYISAGGGWVPQVPAVLGQANATAQVADNAAFLTFAVPSHMSGSYRISSNEKVTSVGTTSTLPAVRVSYTDADDSVVVSNLSLSATNAGNATTTQSNGSQIVNAKGGTNIVVNTNGYASTGAAMQFSTHVRIEFLG
jgi:hypothetical protein